MAPLTLELHTGNCATKWHEKKWIDFEGLLISWPTLTSLQLRGQGRTGGENTGEGGGHKSDICGCACVTESEKARAFYVYMFSICLCSDFLYLWFLVSVCICSVSVYVLISCPVCNDCFGLFVMPIKHFWIWIWKRERQKEREGDRERKRERQREGEREGEKEREDDTESRREGWEGKKREAALAHCINSRRT